MTKAQAELVALLRTTASHIEDGVPADTAYRHPLAERGGVVHVRRSAGPSMRTGGSVKKPDERRPERTKLKPCPTCGWAAQIVERGSYANPLATLFSVECRHSGCDSGTDDYDIRTEAIAAWNRRPR